MRMWMVDPQVLCKKHLLREHAAIHMLAGMIRAGKSLEGYVAKGLVDTSVVAARHDALAAEMVTRYFNHASPISVPPVKTMGKVNSVASLDELARRCEWCALRQAGRSDFRDDFGPNFALDGDPHPDFGGRRRRFPDGL